MLILTAFKLRVAWRRRKTSLPLNDLRVGQVGYQKRDKLLNAQGTGRTGGTGETKGLVTPSSSRNAQDAVARTPVQKSKVKRRGLCIS
eukprot:gene928-biopygen9367